MENTNNKRLLIVLLLSSIVAVTNFPPNAGSEIKKDDTVSDKSVVKHLFIQFVVLMFLISLLSYNHLIKYQTQPLSNLENVTTVLILIGFGIRMWSYYELGNSFTFTLKTGKDQKLIKTGPYKYLAHPSYTAQVLVIIGSIFLLTKSWTVSLGLVGLSWIIISKRIKVEEGLMRKKFGNKYDKYLENRSRLIPFIY